MKSMSFTVFSYNATILLIQPNPMQPTTCAGKCDPTQPNATQPNPWMDPTHVHLWVNGRQGVCRHAHWKHAAEAAKLSRGSRSGVFNLWSADPRGSAGSFQWVREQSQKNRRPIAFLLNKITGHINVVGTGF